MLRRALLQGLAYGMAVAIVDLGFGTWNFTQNNLPAFTEGVLESTFWHFAIGAVLGLVAAPLAQRPRLHLLAMTVLWLAIACWAAVDRAVVPMWASPALGGMLLVLVGGLLQRARWLPLAIGTVALATLCFAPRLHQSMTDEDYVKRERPLPAPLAAGSERRPDVVVVVLDTVRAQSMSAYGYGLATTPVFDELAKSSALFLDASAPSTWSLPSHASLFTGVYPTVHGAHDEHRLLTKERPTLGELLGAAGYQTLAFTANPWISDHLGLTRGFEWSDEAWRTGGGGRAFFFAFRLLDKLGFGPQDKGGAVVAGNFEDWMASRPADARPAFAFLNFLEAHFPHHQLPKDYLARFCRLTDAEMTEYSRRLFATQFGPPLSEVETQETKRPAREMYDAGVAYTDALLGRVVEALRRRGSLDETLLVILADHGELLGEHGEFGHGLSIFQPTMRVPLLLRLPGVVKSARVETPVSTAAVLSTVLDALGLEALAMPEVLPSLLPVIDGQPGGGPVIAERFSGHGGGGRKHPLLSKAVRLRAYRSGPLKLVESSSGEVFLFDLPKDPHEERNVAGERGDDVARLRRELSGWAEKTGLPRIDSPEIARGAGELELDPAARERLRALGYLDD